MKRPVVRPAGKSSKNTPTVTPAHPTWVGGVSGAAGRAGSGLLDRAEVDV
jgi:hypothetical protein